MADAAASKKATDVVLLEMAELLGITDWFVLATASNARQLRAVVDEVEARLRERRGQRPLRRDGHADAGWVVLDYGDVMVHVFAPEQREFYALERLWGDAPRIAYSEPAAVT